MADVSEKVVGLQVSGATEKKAVLNWKPSTLDDVASYEVTVSGVSRVIKTKKTTVTVKKLTPGEHTFTVRALDRDKNTIAVSAATTFDVKDITAPKKGRINLTQTGTTVNLSISNFKDAGGIKEYRIYLGDKLIGTTSGTNYSYDFGETAGKLAFSVVAVDDAGNVSKAAKKTLRVKDMIAPDRVTGLKVITATEKRTVLTWNVPDDNVGAVRYEVVVNGKTYKTKKNTITIKKLKAGDTSFVVYAIDKAKNVSQVSAAQKFTVLDGTDPKRGKITVTQVPGNQDSIRISMSGFTDNMGVAGYIIKVNGKVVDDDFKGSAYTYTKDGLAGKVKVEVSAFDAAGNESKAAKKTIRLKDMTDPGKVTGVRIVGTPTAAATVITWNVATDNVGVVGYEVEVDDRTYKTKTNSITIKKLSAGTHTVTVEAVDKAKNDGDESDPLKFTIGGTTPGGTTPGGTTPGGSEGKYTIGGVAPATFVAWSEEYGYSSMPASATFNAVVCSDDDDVLTFTANRSRVVKGSISLLDGNDKMILADSTGKEESDTVVYANDDYGKVDLGEGNDSLYIGKNTELDADFLLFGDGNDIMTITGGEAEVRTVDFGEGDDELILTGAASEAAEGYIWATEMTFGDGNDIVDIGAYTDLDIEGALLDFGEGNDELIVRTKGEIDAADGRIRFDGGDDVFAIAQDSRVQLISSIDFGEGDDTLNLNGTLILDAPDSTEQIANLEKITGSGELVIGSAADYSAAFLDRFENAGIRIIEGGDNWSFSTSQREGADDTRADAVELAAGDDIDVWLCGQDAANGLTYGFEDSVDFIKFTKTSSITEVYFGTNDAFNAQIQDKSGTVLADYDISGSQEYSLSSLKNGSVYYIRTSVASNARAVGYIELD